VTDITTPILVLGFGQVGRTLVQQILETREALARRKNLILNLTGVADSQALLHDPAGLTDQALARAIDAKAQGRSLASLSGHAPQDRMPDLLDAGIIVVDVTASDGTEVLLRHAAAQGGGVVLANKRPLAGPWSQARVLLAHPHLRYEATVGAGLPVIATLQGLLDAGDQVISIEGCMSGTLGYLCAELERGSAYADAVRQAHARGFTESDPREDLSGRDVARKALILARTAGWPLEAADLEVEALYPDEMGALTTAAFMGTMDQLNAGYARRVREAAARGQVLRYVARVGPQGGRVGLAAVDAGSQLGALRGPANFIALHTARYDPEPLAISGPGAGLAVTAGGVLADIIDLALHRAAQAPD
jgi:homoserine dehydrogenase